jgi:hypothetical protein
MYNWLVLLNLAAAFYSVGTIWLTQVDWRLWQYVGKETFDAYHLAWWHSVWWSIFPLAGLSFIGICAQLIWRPSVPLWMLWLALAIQLVAYAGTAFWWGRGQARLQQAVLPQGGLDPLYQLLVRTNWIRVALFTSAGLLQLWIALVSFSH